MYRQVLNKKVYIGLSGGVDSSVSAALLKNAGYSVTGVFIRVWQPSFAKATEGKPDFFMHCTAGDDRLDAMRVCAKLNIPFVELDLEKEYKKEVVDYMIREYSVGKTPNPDVMCNRYIKFGGFYKWAMKNGADFVATGHYARILSSLHSSLSFPRRRESSLDSPAPLPEGSSRRMRGGSAGNDKFALATGLDTNKDQSYFLWQIRKEQLPHILFPVGKMKKPEVRKLAKKFGLITADKKDSQGLCFVGKVDMKEFLSHYIKPKKGNVLDSEGNSIGKHDGALFYTLGERIPLICRHQVSTECGHLMSTDAQHANYVVSKNIKKNTLTVAQKSFEGTLGGAIMEVSIKNCNWLIEFKKGKVYSARTRYRQPLQNCIVESSSPPFQGGDRGVVASSSVLVRFSSPQTVAPGQSLVLYDGDVLVGGGVIS